MQNLKWKIGNWLESILFSGNYPYETGIIFHIKIGSSEGRKFYHEIWIFATSFSQLDRVIFESGVYLIMYRLWLFCILNLICSQPGTVLGQRTEIRIYVEAKHT